MFNTVFHFQAVWKLIKLRGQEIATSDFRQARNDTTVSDKRFPLSVGLPTLLAYFFKIFLAPPNSGADSTPACSIASMRFAARL